MTETIPLVQALAEVDRLQAAAEKWQAEQVTKTAELETFEASAAARLVDDPAAADRLTDEAARLRAGLALTKRTRETAEGQLTEARRGVLLARAAELRAEAASKRAEADDLDKRAAPLLEQLQALMGCRYEPPLDFGTSGVSGSGSRRLTKTQVLRNRANHLDVQAEDLERFAAERTAEQIATKAAQVRGQAAAAEQVAVA